MKTFKHMDWRLLFGSLPVGIVIALTLPKRISHFSLPDLIVGPNMWNFTPHIEFAFAWSFVIGMLLCWLCLEWIKRLIDEKGSLVHADVFARFTFYSALPTLAWIGSLVPTTNKYVGHPHLSIMILGLVVVITFVLVFIAQTKPPEFENSLKGWCLFIFLVPFTSVGVAFFTNRVLYKVHSLHFLISFRWALASIILALLWFGFLSWRGRQNSKLQRQSLFFSLIGVQVLLCFLLFDFYPTPLLDGHSIRPLFPVNRFFGAMVLFLLIVCLLDLLRRALNCSRHGYSCNPLKSISPLVVVLPILLISVGWYIPEVRDDFHTGEKLLPYWVWKNFNFLPFVDHIPIHSFSNIVPCFLSDLFLGNVSVGGCVFGESLMGKIAIYVTAVLTCRLSPVGAVFVMFCLPLRITLCPELLLGASSCLLLHPLILRRPKVLLLLWFLLCQALILFEASLGMSFWLSTFPIAIFAFIRMIKNNQVSPILNLRTVIILAVLSLGVFLTPLHQILFAMFSRMKECSEVYAPTFALPWHLSTQGSFFDIIRFSWIWAVPVLLACGISKWLTSKNLRNKSHSLYLLALGLFPLCSMLYSLTRIDPFDPSRTGRIALFVFGLGLPIYFFSSKLRRSLVVPGVLAVMLGIFSLGQFAIVDYKAPLFMMQKAGWGSNKWIEGAEIGMPNLGSVWITDQNLARISALKHALDKWLSPNETYLDLTNHTAHYMYVSRPPPLETGSYYTLIHSRQHERSVKKLRQHPPPVALVQADNIVHDRVSLSLRANPIYRFMVAEKNYVPIESNGLWYLVDRDRARGLGLIGSIPSARETNTKLDELLGLSRLDSLPSYWGRALTGLMHRLHPVPIQPAVHVLATDPTGIMVDIARFGLSGRDIDLISFELHCQQSVAAKVVVEMLNSPQDVNKGGQLVFTGHNGPQLVPVDVKPSWLLSRHVQGYSIHPGCQPFKISDVALYKRKSSLAAPTGTFYSNR
ncbi:MAG: hypothetical protein HY537_12435 [Deltaproteobacteria bacterium]|nr:hypothetical protein [Deltaproteobacteria bacterium]